MAAGASKTASSKNRAQRRSVKGYGSRHKYLHGGWTVQMGQIFSPGEPAALPSPGDPSLFRSLHRAHFCYNLMIVNARKARVRASIWRKSDWCERRPRANAYKTQSSRWEGERHGRLPRDAGWCKLMPLVANHGRIGRMNILTGAIRVQRDHGMSQADSGAACDQRMMASAVHGGQVVVAGRRIGIILCLLSAVVTVTAASLIAISI